MRALIVCVYGPLGVYFNCVTPNKWVVFYFPSSRESNLIHTHMTACVDIGRVLGAIPPEKHLNKQQVTVDALEEPQQHDTNAIFQIYSKHIHN